MGKKSVAAIGALGLFVAVAFVTWKTLDGEGGPAMTLPPISFPAYAAQKQKVTTTNVPGEQGSTLSLNEACSSFNTTVRETAARANFCRTDADCAVESHDVCALGCEYLFNRRVDINSILTAAVTYQEHECPECPKVCIRHQIQSIVCRNNVCVVK